VKREDIAACLGVGVASVCRVLAERKGRRSLNERPEFERCSRLTTKPAA